MPKSTRRREMNSREFTGLRRKWRYTQEDIYLANIARRFRLLGHHTWATATRLANTTTNTATARCRCTLTREREGHFVA